MTEESTEVITKREYNCAKCGNPGILIIDEKGLLFSECEKCKKEDMK